MTETGSEPAQEQQNTGMFQLASALQAASSRQYYLSFEDLLEDMGNTWRGGVKDGDEWMFIKENRIMSEEAIGWLTGLLRSFLSIPNRLADQTEEKISQYAYDARKHISALLHRKGWISYGIAIEYLRPISFQCGQLIHASLTWSKSAGGFNRLNTSIRSVESISQMLHTNEQPQHTENEFVPQRKLWG